MKISDIRCLRGPNRWSIRYPQLVEMKLDLEDLENFPTNLVPGFYDRLRETLPSLVEHQCSEGHPGGFFERVKDGTWMGHVIEHLALELQTLAGMDCGFGRTRSASKAGVYNVVIEYQQEQAGRYAAERAVALAQALADDRPFDLAGTLAELRRLGVEQRLGPSTSAIVEACTRRGIPHIRLNSDSFVQLGYGSKQKRIDGTVTSQTSALAVELASDKNETKCLLADADVPVPAGTVIQTEAELGEALKQIGFPAVLKPLDGNHGRGVTTNLQSLEAARVAFGVARAQSRSGRVVVETFVRGHDYRLLVIGYRLCAAAKRLPARVVGDGTSTIRELVEQVNQDPRRGEGHEQVLTKIRVDDAAEALLRRQGVTLDSVPAPGRKIVLKDTANLSTGGTSVDLTDRVHPEVARMAERAARTVGLDVCGIDVIATDLTRPLAESGARVIEVNAAPGFRMHTHPAEGKSRDVGRNVADLLFPSDQGRIPILAVTGTNGKTTTTRLLAHLMRQTGRRVGFTTTEGIYVDGILLEAGDCTGPVSNGKILRDPTVDVAVLECARGGILRAGLAFDHCDVGIVTNVAADHLGLKDIETVEAMAHVKAVVAESVHPEGYAVLNADNELTYAMRERVKSRVALFSRYPESARIREHGQTGGLAAVVEDGYIVLRWGQRHVRVAPIAAIPLTFGGKAPFMIENVLAATVAAFCQQVPVDQIARGLRTFEASAEMTPGRMNRFCFRDFCFLIDYAHNAHGLAALGEYIRQEEATCRMGILAGVGDRRDEDLRAFGRLAAELFDDLVLRSDEDSRGRDPHEIIALLCEGARSVDPGKSIRVIPDELAALEYAVRHAPPGALVVHLTEQIGPSLTRIREFRDLDERVGLRQQPQLV